MEFLGYKQARFPHHILNPIQSKQSSFCQQFRREGCLTVPGFLTVEEADSLRASCHSLVEEMDPSAHTPTVFSTTEHDQVGYTVGRATVTFGCHCFNMCEILKNVLSCRL